MSRREERLEVEVIAESAEAPVEVVRLPWWVRLWRWIRGLFG